MKLLKDYKHHMDGCLRLGLLTALAKLSNIVTLGISQFYIIYFDYLSTKTKHSTHNTLLYHLSVVIKDGPLVVCGVGPVCR